MAASKDHPADLPSALALHAQLLAALDEFIHSMTEDDYPATGPLLALRDVVASHRPAPLPYSPGDFYCVSCATRLWPDCSTIKLIMGRLGIEEIK